MEKPFQLFAEWFALAEKTQILDPTAMCLATSTADGKPSARIVLLKDFDEKGFVFYTNSQSRKGGELLSNPNCALCFYWDELNKQVRIEGKIEKVQGEEADSYFKSRHVEKQYGAWASKQSQKLEKREDLYEMIEEYKQKFPQDPPRPPHWHGFRVVPTRIEFWQDGEFRLHDREVFEKIDNRWQSHKLYP
jgi:pyridoxamine 5'-phosphate oxidase